MSSGPRMHIPTLSPPTPVQSPEPEQSSLFTLPSSPSSRLSALSSLIHTLSPAELVFVSTSIAPLLKRDLLGDLPVEIGLHILTFVDEPKTIARAAQVSKSWRRLVSDQAIWKRLSRIHGFRIHTSDEYTHSDTLDPALEWLISKKIKHNQHAPTLPPLSLLSCEQQFKTQYSTLMNWRHGGDTLLRSHRIPISPNSNQAASTSSNPSVVDSSLAITCLSIDISATWVVVGLANSKIHVFSARTGVLSRTLVGHSGGVWSIGIVGAGGYMSQFNEEAKPTCPDTSSWRSDDDLQHRGRHSALNLDSKEQPEIPFPSSTGKPSDPVFASEGWGQPNALIVSGGSDTMVRVWDVKSGGCIYTFSGHAATIRCLRVAHNRPIAISGSRDSTLRVWDIQKGGPCLRVLEGHTDNVRCMDICGNRVVSGSYDSTCRIWNVDTGECLHILRGHYHQVYSVAFDGVLVASGSLDTTVRIYDAETGNCIALLQSHTALVCQLQLSQSARILATGGSDGRVILFSLDTFSMLDRINAHEASVTSLQFDSQFLITSGNDGRVQLYDIQSFMDTEMEEPDRGKMKYVRELSDGSDTVWKVGYRRGAGDVCAITCRRAGKTVIEIWNMRPKNAL